MNEIKDETITFKIPIDLKREFKSVCYKNGITMADVTVNMISNYVKNSVSGQI